MNTEANCTELQLWGVGRIIEEGALHPFYVSHDDMLADTAWWEQVLFGLNLPRNAGCYIPHFTDELAQFWPVFLALKSLRVPVCTGMDSSFDAYRLEMFLRRIPLSILFGLSQDMIEGLEQGDHDVVKLLGKVEHLFARPSAWSYLDKRSISHWKMITHGPVTFIQEPGSKRFKYNAEEWQITCSAGQLLALPIFPDRGTRFSESVRLGAGDIDEDGVFFTTL